MTETTTTNLDAIAEAVADGDVRLALDALKKGLEGLPGMRELPEVARLYREIIQHRGSIVRLERDAGGGRLTADSERVERAKLTAACLDVADELEQVERQRGLRIPVDVAALSAARAPAMAKLADTDGVALDGDVFLSYARPDRADIVDLAVALRGRGCSVWFDHYIAGGAKFRDIITSRLDAARAVVVLWSEASIKSDWVLYEADRAHKAGKLVPIRKRSLQLESVPAPYPAVLNIIVEGDQDLLVRSLAARGVPRPAG